MRMGLLLALTVAEVVVGLWLIPLAAGGTPCSSYGCRGHQFASWLWPTICVAGLSLIWLSAAWSLVIKPVRLERRYGRIRHHLAPAVTTTKEAEGWFEDPYRVHHYRWFSMGQPSSLVRDGLIESEDPPPHEPYVGVLVPESGTAESGADGADLKRAGDGQKADYWDAAVDASTWFPTN